MPDIILASASPRREELLRLMGLDFRVLPSDFDESTVAPRPPDRHVQESATGKATDVASRISEGVVIAADTVVVLDDAILGKPADDADACRMLRMLSDRSHYVYTGLCVMERTAAGSVQALGDYVRTEVRFGRLDEQIIAAYVATGEPRDKAGAYGIQERGSVLVEGIVGDYFNVVGLPIYRLSRMLSDIGIRPFG